MVMIWKSAKVQDVTENGSFVSKLNSAKFRQNFIRTPCKQYTSIRGWRIISTVGKGGEWRRRGMEEVQRLKGGQSCMYANHAHTVPLTRQW